MIYHYTFTKIDTKNLFMQVKYSREGHKDVLKNFDLTNAELTTAGLERVAESYASVVVARWDSISKAPEVVIPENTQKEAHYVPPVPKENISDPFPDYDMFTQKVTPVLEETDTHIRNTWAVTDLTEQEQAEFLSGWRSFTQVTPRQARLELAKRGQLSNIDEIIASLPADQQEVVQIEWEYAVSVERSSPWVIQLGSALGLDEAGLDELFKAAAEL